jgi:hypothetical protein
VAVVPWHLLGVSKDLATEFVGVFARFEYALKVTGFVSGGPRRAKADWESFGQSVAVRFDRHASQELNEAVDYLLLQPPGVEALQGATVGFVAPQFEVGASELKILLCCVRIVRNNLFHGGKFWPQDPRRHPDRDRKLVEAGLRILDAALPLDPRVDAAFRT